MSHPIFPPATLTALSSAAAGLAASLAGVRQTAAPLAVAITKCLPASPPKANTLADLNSRITEVCDNHR